jgi:cysteine desulfurase
MIYLDYAAGTPVRAEVVASISLRYANPSSIHAPGEEAKFVLQDSRFRIANILGCDGDEIVFTSGGTESINLAIKGVVNAGAKGKHIITSKIEHPAVLRTCEFLEKNGCKVSYVGVNSEGIVDVKDIAEAITSETVLVSIMYMNNETGAVQPIKEIARMLKGKGIYFHTDACQAGYLDLNVNTLGVDLMTLNSGKVYGPAGVGLLYLRKGVEIEPLLHGGEQQVLRSGTENVVGITGFARALELAQTEKMEVLERMKQLGKEFLRAIGDLGRVNGKAERGIINLHVGVEGEQVVKHLSEQGVYVSSGSACSAQSMEPSHVLLAMGLSEKEALNSIRVSIGRETTIAEVQEAAIKLLEIVPELRKMQLVI